MAYLSAFSLLSQTQNYTIPILYHVHLNCSVPLSIPKLSGVFFLLLQSITISKFLPFWGNAASLIIIGRRWKGNRLEYYASAREWNTPGKLMKRSVHRMETAPNVPFLTGAPFSSLDLEKTLATVTMHVTRSEGLHKSHVSYNFPPLTTLPGNCQDT